MLPLNNLGNKVSAIPTLTQRDNIRYSCSQFDYKNSVQAFLICLSVKVSSNLGKNNASIVAPGNKFAPQIIVGGYADNTLLTLILLR